jgi:hypothetical protein
MLASTSAAAEMIDASSANGNGRAQKRKRAPTGAETSSSQEGPIELSHIFSGSLIRYFSFLLMRRRSNSRRILSGGAAAHRRFFAPAGFVLLANET